MKKIKVLGSGCSKCTMLYEKIKGIIFRDKLDASVEKITDMMVLISLGVMDTPAIMIDDKIVSSGKIPDDEEIKSMILN